MGHNQLQVVGPPELVIWIKALQRHAADPEAKQKAYDKKLADYYVTCSQTGEQVPLSDLKYWNVETQEVFKDAEAALARHTATRTCT